MDGFGDRGTVSDSGKWWRWFGVVKDKKESEGRPLTDLTDWILDGVGFQFTVKKCLEITRGSDFATSAGPLDHL